MCVKSPLLSSFCPLDPSIACSLPTCPLSSVKLAHHRQIHPAQSHHHPVFLTLAAVSESVRRLPPLAECSSCCQTPCLSQQIPIIRTNSRGPTCHYGSPDDCASSVGYLRAAVGARVPFAEGIWLRRPSCRSKIKLYPLTSPS